MDSKQEKEENDFGIPFNFNPDVKNDINEVENEEIAKILTIESLTNKGYIDAAFDVLLDLNSDINDNN